MQLVAAGEEEDGGNGGCDRDPMGQGEGDCAQHIGLNVEYRHDKPDIGLAFFVLFVDVLLIIDESQAPSTSSPPVNGIKANRVEQVECAAAQCQQRKSANPAGSSGIVAAEKILVRETKKEA